MSVLLISNAKKFFSLKFCLSKISSTFIINLSLIVLSLSNKQKNTSSNWTFLGVPWGLGGGFGRSLEASAVSLGVHRGLWECCAGHLIAKVAQTLRLCMFRSCSRGSLGALGGSLGVCVVLGSSLGALGDHWGGLGYAMGGFEGT